MTQRPLRARERAKGIGCFVVSAQCLEILPPIPAGLGLGLSSAARLGKAVRRRLIDEPVDALFVPGNCHWPFAAASRGIANTQRLIIVVQVSNALRKPRRGQLRQLLFEAWMRQRLKAADAVVTIAETDRILANQILRRTDCIAIASPAVGACTEPPLPNRWSGCQL